QALLQAYIIGDVVVFADKAELGLAAVREGTGDHHASRATLCRCFLSERGQVARSLSLTFVAQLSLWEARQHRIKNMRRNGGLALTALNGQLLPLQVFHLRNKRHCSALQTHVVVATLQHAHLCTQLKCNRDCGKRTSSS